MKSLLIFSLAASLPLHAFARLGETEDQIESRYGKPVASTEQMGLEMQKYDFSGIEITVGFVEGKSGWESFKKEDGSDFSDHEIGLIMTANSSGQSWAQDDDISDFLDRKWKLSDGSVVACYDTIKHTLDLLTSEMLKALRKGSNAEESAKLKGL